MRHCDTICKGDDWSPGLGGAVYFGDATMDGQNADSATISRDSNGTVMFVDSVFQSNIGAAGGGAVTHNYEDGHAFFLNTTFHNNIIWYTMTFRAKWKHQVLPCFFLASFSSLSFPFCSSHSQAGP